MISFAKRAADRPRGRLDSTVANKTSAPIIITSSSVPSIFAARSEARTVMRDFFSSYICNPNTRRAYREAIRQFSAFGAEQSILDLSQVQPIPCGGACRSATQASIQTNSEAAVGRAANAVRLDGSVRTIFKSGGKSSSDKAAPGKKLEIAVCFGPALGYKIKQDGDNDKEGSHKARFPEEALLGT